VSPPAIFLITTRQFVVWLLVASPWVFLKKMVTNELRKMVTNELTSRPALPKDDVRSVGFCIFNRYRTALSRSFAHALDPTRRKDVANRGVAAIYPADRMTTPWPARAIAAVRCGIDGGPIQPTG